MGGGNGQKSATARARAQAKNEKPKGGLQGCPKNAPLLGRSWYDAFPRAGSQLKANQAAMNLKVCLVVCTYHAHPQHACWEEQLVYAACISSLLHGGHTGPSTSTPMLTSMHTKSCTCSAISACRPSSARWVAVLGVRRNCYTPLHWCMHGLAFSNACARSQAHVRMLECCRQQRSSSGNTQSPSIQSTIQRCVLFLPQQQHWL